MPADPPGPTYRLDSLRMPALVGLAATALPLAGLLAFRARLVFEIGPALWGLAAAVATALAVLAAARLFDRRPLVLADTGGLHFPRRIAEPLPWRDIAGIEAETRAGRLGDRRDVLIVRFIAPRRLTWRRSAGAAEQDILEQTALAVPLDWHWPARARQIRDALLAVRPSVDAARPAAMPESRATGRRWPRGAIAAAATLTAVVLPVAWHGLALGVPKGSEAGVVLYHAGDIAAARPSLLDAARRGDAVSQRLLARMYANGDGVGRNEAAAAEWYGRAAGAGDVDSVLALAELHRRGLGLPKDAARARALYRGAADAGSAVAAYRLALMLVAGEGGERDAAAARHRLGRAADGGVAAAERELALLMRAGLGGPRDPVAARRMLAGASASGDAEARYHLARMAASGDGGPADLGLAAELYRAAAEQGHAPAQYLLGLAYQTGEGVAADPVEAYTWLALAEKALPPYKRPRAARMLTRVATVLAPAELETAKRRVREWRPVVR